MIPIGDVPDRIQEEYGWKPALGTVRAWIREGRVKGVKFGGRVFVECESLEHIAKTMKEDGNDAPIQA